MRPNNWGEGGPPIRGILQEGYAACILHGALRERRRVGDAAGLLCARRYGEGAAVDEALRARRSVTDWSAPFESAIVMPGDGP